MSHRFLLALCALCFCLTAVDSAKADNHYRARRMAATRPWNANYYNPAYSYQPMALVVPPTASMQVRWGWGIAQSESVPLYHQFGRPYPGPGANAGGGPFYPTPYWPSHTDQFGVYYVRGPW